MAYPPPPFSKTLQLIECNYLRGPGGKICSALALSTSGTSYGSDGADTSVRCPPAFGEICLDHRVCSMVGSISLSMTYGVDILPENDPNMELARRASKSISESLPTGFRFVDIIPILRYFPAWLPGASFQKIAAESRIIARNLREGIFTKAQKKWVSSSSFINGMSCTHLLRKSSHASLDPSFTSLCLDDCHEGTGEEQMTVIKDVAGIVYMGKNTNFSPSTVR